MDFSIFYQLSQKKAWWIDALFYLAISLVLATMLCYVIFLVQISLTNSAIKKETAALTTVGTQGQKSQEQTVLAERKKINDFSTLLKNHQFASNVFSFLEQEAMPYVWFRQFVLSEKDATVQLFGQTDTEDDLSRQINTFETDPNVSKVSLLNSSLAATGVVNFNISLVLQKKIFQYASSSLSQTTSDSQSPDESADTSANSNQ